MIGKKDEQHEEGKADLHQKRYRHFSESGQAKLKLNDALDGFFDEDTPENVRTEYRNYIRKRIRPASDALAADQRMDELSVLLHEGILTDAGLDELIERMKNPAAPAVWLGLVRLREEHKHTEGVIPYKSRRILSPEGMIKQCRKDIYYLFPMLDGALAGLKTITFSQNESEESAEVDGEYMRFDREWLKEKWQVSPWVVRRGMLHMILHCMYGHLWDADVQDQRISLSFDIFVEFLIERECWKKKSLRKYLGYLDMPGVWSELYDSMNGKVSSPVKIAEQIGGRITETTLGIWRSVFCFDDHRAWKNNEQSKKLAGNGSDRCRSGELFLQTPVIMAEQLLRSKWAMIAQSAGNGAAGAVGTLGVGSEAGGETDEAGVIRRSVTDYRKFLQQFAVAGEEPELDLNSFDYIYYTIGMEQYDQMPLIEPLEYAEGHKLEELVIAIDTSGSCKTETVRRFLEEIRAILEEKENFFKKMNVWIIQCDCVIQNVVHIQSNEDWNAYIRHLKIRGRAGTDFRPVFRYVEELRKKRELKALKGLIYFTDGDGAYPREETDYQTAFAFLQETPCMQQVPGWAKILIVGEQT